MTNQPASFLTRSHIFAAVLFAIFIFLLYQMARLLAPFSSAMLWAAILALALSPVHTRLLRLVNGREGLAAGVITFSTLLRPLVVTLLTAFVQIYREEYTERQE